MQSQNQTTPISVSYSKPLRGKDIIPPSQCAFTVLKIPGMLSWFDTLLVP